MEIIAGSAKNLAQEHLINLANYRYKVFVESLGWDLNTPAGIELDQFDRPDTIYVMARNQAHEIVGCARLLPTTGAYLLEEVFPELLNGLPPPKSREVWELSRFATVDFGANEVSHYGQFSSTITLNILATVIQHAKKQGAKRLISVSPLGVERLLRHAGYKSHRAGPPLQVDGKWIIACWIEIPN